MSTTLPKEVKDRIQARLWDKADELHWAKCSDSDRATWYGNWAKDKDIGGVLAHYMDPRRVRVYIKDSLLKPYQRVRLEEDLEAVLGVVGVPKGTKSTATFIKPHGRMLLDGRLICWGNSRDWKTVIVSVFERAYAAKSASPFAAVLLETGKTADTGLREMVSDVGRRLGLTKVVWLE